MNIITVIPLTRQKVAESLLYFTTRELPIGAIVNVPLRSKTIHAIVSSSRSAEEMKIEIKKADFEIRKLGRVKVIRFFSTGFMIACKRLSDYYATNIGAIIDTLINNTLLENANKVEKPIHSRPKSNDEVYAIQGDDSDRISSWRSLIRQEFARKKSIVFHTPTIEDAMWLERCLVKGIEDYVFLLHGNLAEKKTIETWNKIAKNDHPIVVIATGSFSVLPREDIETVVIERENSRGWINIKSPYVDLRLALETIAKSNGQRVYLSDSMLRLETLYRLDQNEITSGSPFKWRSVSVAVDSLINMTNIEKRGVQEEKPKFRILSKELETTISKNIEENTHLFIFGARRGLATTTICDDCESIVSCNKCGSPIVLHSPTNHSSSMDMKSKNFFLCHKCGERRSVDEVCKKCGSWRLTPLGIGIDRVYEEISNKFPNIDLLKIDADSTKNARQIESIIEKFKSKPGSILLGTELAITHLPQKIDHIAIASLDSLFALPDHRIPEKIMYMIVRLRTIAERSILVQTRRAGEKIFEYGLKGNLSDFYRTMLEDRKIFHYPPYRNLIKITIEGKKGHIALAMSSVQKILEPNEVEVFPAFTATSRGNSAIHGLIRIEAKRWPDMVLVEKLRKLSPNISVRIDPESLL